MPGWAVGACAGDVAAHRKALWRGHQCADSARSSRTGRLLVLGKGVTNVLDDGDQDYAYGTDNAAEKKHLKDMGAQLSQLFHAQILEHFPCDGEN